MSDLYYPVPHVMDLDPAMVVRPFKISDRTERIFAATGAGTEEDRDVYQVTGGYWLMAKNAYEDVEGEDFLTPGIENMMAVLRNMCIQRRDAKYRAAAELRCSTYALGIPNRLQHNASDQEARHKSLPVQQMSSIPNDVRTYDTK